jgi:hypothetical protein
MATKKQGGGSNTGLIVTLVFFVLTTVILGVTTYTGYSEQEANTKKVKDAEAKATTMTKERNYHRATARILRAYMGFPEAKGDAKDTARIKEQLDKGTYPDASGVPEANEFRTFLGNLGKAMPWNPAAPDNHESPTITYEMRLQARDKDIEALKTQLAAAKARADDAEAKRAEAAAALAAAKKNFKAEVDKVTADAEKAREKDRMAIADLTAELNKANEAKNSFRDSDAALKLQLAKLTQEAKKLKDEVSEVKKERERAKGERDEIAKAFALLQEKTGKSAEEIEAKVLDDDALSLLRNWDLKRKDWRIVAMDRTGQQPYINLGWADNLHPQMTFSIHKLGPDGRLASISKGTLEVVRVIGPHQAQCRLTSMSSKADRARDPIVKGDYLFNPVWDPSQKRRVVLAGLADMNNEGTDSTKAFRELLKRQNVDLGGWIDVSDDKAPPKLEGEGVNRKTDYLIIGDNLDDVHHKRTSDKEFKEAFSRIVTEQREKAKADAIPVITLRRYLQMVGYVPPRVEKSHRD